MIIFTETPNLAGEVLETAEGRVLSLEKFTVVLVSAGSSVVQALRILLVALLENATEDVAATTF
jgi:hypothetical protein